MGDVRVGTASWTDPTLIEVSWYPAQHAFARLRFVRNRMGYDTDPQTSSSR